MISHLGKHAREERGAVTVIAAFVMVLMVILGLTFLTRAQNEDISASNFRNKTQAFYAAEAGLEKGLVDLRSLLAQNPNPSVADLSDPNNISAPIMTDPSYTFNTFAVQRIRPTPYSTTINTGSFAGLIAQTTDYEITAAVRGPRRNEARLGEVIQYLEIPLFQFGVFYGRGVDLEIAPGPPMTFNGRVHANSNIYIRNDSSQFDSFLTTVGNVYRYLKRDPATRGSNPKIKDGSGTYQALNFDYDYDYNFNNPWAAQDWKDAALNTFNGLVQDSTMGVQEIIPPIPDLFYDPANPAAVSHKMIEKGDAADSPAMQAAKPYYEADLKIAADAAGVITATDKNGNPVSLASCAPTTISTQSFYDKREEATITVTEVDIGALESCGKMPANGLLYVHREGTQQGVRLTNGSQLPSQGLTVVSENPVYVQGDYNTVNKKAAAVMADAITVLSNNWGPNNSDGKGDQTTSNRPATATTVNAAFALGPNAESVVGQGNGQLENVIRFLENWNGQNFNYNGSIIALWHSQQATGDWRCCGNSGNNYYRPPNRNWAYDTLFDTSIPPGTPRGILTMKARWSQT